MYSVFRRQSVLFSLFFLISNSNYSSMNLIFNISLLGNIMSILF